MADLSARTIVRHQRLVKAIFPENAAVGAIEKKFEEICFERSINDMGTDASIQQVILAIQLRDEIVDFKEEQLLRIRDIQFREKYANMRIENAREEQAAHILRVGKPLPVEDSSYNWEHDTEDGDRFIEKDQFHAVITKQQEKIRDLKDKLNYEKMLHLKLESILQNFARYAKLAGIEAALSTQNRELEKIFAGTGEDVSEERMRANDWAMKAILDADAEAAAEEKEMADDEREGGGVGNTHTYGQPSLGSTRRGGESGSTPAAQSFAATALANFCTYCERGGVVDTCFHCGKQGHVEGGCFYLHPELREEYRKTRVAPFCTWCMVAGHWKKFCYDLNPELRRDGGGTR